MAGPAQPDAGTARAWGWVHHLLEGGTVPWRDWTGEWSGEWPGEWNGGRKGPLSGRVVPGAQQLELLRRLNELGSPVPPELATRVLEASAPGRGRPDLELVGAAHDSRFGARPVDPSELPDDELLRVATYLLGEDLVALGPVAGRPDALPRPWRRRYRLVGDPVLSDPVRRRLVARGHGPRPGGRIVVVGSDLERMLADAWTARCFDQGVGSWPEWLEAWRQRGRVPPRVDLPRVARTWAERRGAERVHVLLEGTPEWERLPGLVGVRRLDVPPRPGAEAAELARRVAAVLGLMVTPGRRAELLRDGLLPRLPGEVFVPVGAGDDAVGDTGGDAGPSGLSETSRPAHLPRLPEEHREWVARRATRMTRRLRRDGYPVRVLDVAPGPRSQDGAHADDASRAHGVLSLAMRMLLGGWKEPV